MPRSKLLSEQMRTRSRERLLSAARSLFAQQGYFSCKVSDIARQAGMSQGNLYWHFEGKEGLLKAILAQGFEALERMTEEVAHLEGSAQERLDFLVKRARELYQEQDDFTRILTSLMAHGGPALIKDLGFDMSQIGLRYHTNLIAVFEQARSEGCVAALEPSILVMLFFSLFNGLVITYGEEWEALPPDIVHQTVMRLLGAEPRE